MGVEDVAAVPVTIGHLMMNQIEEEEQPEPEEYIMNRNGVDFIPSSMVLSAVDAKLRIEMGAERILAGILLTMCEARTNLCKVITEQVSETFAGQLRIFDSKIPNTVKVGELVYYSELLLEYDELIIECSKYVSMDAICEQMGRTPSWATGLVMLADGYETEFYKKD